MKIKIDKKLVDNVMDETKRYHADPTKDKFLALDKEDAIFKIKKQYIGYHIDILDVEKVEVKPHGVDLL